MLLTTQENSSLWSYIAPAVISAVSGLIGAIIGAYVSIKTIKISLDSNKDLKKDYERNSVYKVLAEIVMTGTRINLPEKSVNQCEGGEDGARYKEKFAQFILIAKKVRDRIDDTIMNGTYILYASDDIKSSTMYLLDALSDLAEQKDEGSLNIFKEKANKLLFLLRKELDLLPKI